MSSKQKHQQREHTEPKENQKNYPVFEKFDLMKLNRASENHLATQNLNSTKAETNYEGSEKKDRENQENEAPDHENS